MKLRLLVAGIALLAGSAAQADATNTIKLVQEKLFILGYYDGRIDGDPSGRTQAALAQFQLSRSLPADGAPDQRTLDELGVVVEEDEQASTGSSAPAGATPEARLPES